jgi:hypothetical protein
MNGQLISLQKLKVLKQFQHELPIFRAILMDRHVDTRTSEPCPCGSGLLSIAWCLDCLQYAPAARNVLLPGMPTIRCIGQKSGIQTLDSSATTTSALSLGLRTPFPSATTEYSALGPARLSLSISLTCMAFMPLQFSTVLAVPTGGLRRLNSYFRQVSFLLPPISLKQPSPSRS